MGAKKIKREFTEYMLLNADKDFSLYFEGKKLIGDNFNNNEIRQWHADEKEGYAGIVNPQSGNYEYRYHALNLYYGYNQLPERIFKEVLGFGSALGYEFKPIAHRIEKLSIIEPSDAFVNKAVHGITPCYFQPRPDGILPFANDQFDLITCFGVLHHIPNVSKVVAELFRCLQPNGYMLIREPTVSMGDWRSKRPGLTKRERGIPLHIMRDIIVKSGFKILSEKRCLFSLMMKLNSMWNGRLFYSKAMVAFDRILCKLFSWNQIYHPTTLIQKLRPLSVFYVTQKQKETND